MNTYLRFLLFGFIMQSLSCQCQNLSSDTNIVNLLKESIIKYPENILTDKAESSLTISPDGEQLFFAQKDSFYSYDQNSTIYVSEFVNNNWSTPKIAWFSGKYSDSNPFITPDGKEIYFTSNRPTFKEKEKKDKDIWFICKTQNGWSNPKHIGIYNSDKSEYSPTIDINKNLYFGSYREGGIGSGDIWVSYYVNGEYQSPINLSKQINTAGGEWGSCISPNGDYIIFESSGRKENITYDGDLYISFCKNNAWTPALHLGKINSGGSDLSPKIHNNTLYFASNRHPDFKIQMNNNNVELYKLSLEILWEYLK